jgi:hypothetical protein
MRNTNNIKLNSRNFDDVLNNIVGEVTTSQMEPELTVEDDNAILAQINEENVIPNENNNVLTKFDTMILNNGWNDKNEKIVISIGENASSYKWMHEKSSSLYKLIQKIFSILLILFSTGLSAESILPTDNNNEIINTIRSIITYIITVLTVLQNFLKLEQLGEQHTSSAVRFSELYHDIQQQMCMFRKDRKNAIEFLSTVLKKYDSLVVAGPSIDTIVLNQFKNTFKNSETSIPDIADRIEKIEIITEPNTTSENSQNMVQNKGFSTTVNSTNKNINKTYAKYSNSNLKQINDVFKINGDVSDLDIKNAQDIELKQLRKKFLDEKSSYEFQRFRNNNSEND